MAVALIVAAGRGERLGYGEPKALAAVAGRPMLEWSVAALRESEKGLSSGEKQMYTRAKKILASELMYALDKNEAEAEAYLDELLSRSSDGEAVGNRR